MHRLATGRVIIDHHYLGGGRLVEATDALSGVYNDCDWRETVTY